MGETLHFEAVPIAPKQNEELFLSNIAGGGSGVTRRIAFAFLNKSSQHYYDNLKDEETAEAFLDAAECLDSYIQNLEAHIEMMKSSQARMYVVLQHNFAGV